MFYRTVQAELKQLEQEASLNRPNIDDKRQEEAKLREEYNVRCGEINKIKRMLSTIEIELKQFKITSRSKAPDLSSYVSKTDFGLIKVDLRCFMTVASYVTIFCI